MKRITLAVLAFLLVSCSVTPSRPGTRSNPTWSLEGDLTPNIATAQVLRFRESVFSNGARPITLEMSDGTILARSTSPKGVVSFDLPSTPALAGRRHQCLRVRTATGAVMSVAGTRTNAFVVPEWQNMLGTRFEAPGLMQQQRTLREQVARDTNELRSSQAWLQGHHAVARDGSCVAPPLALHPADACGDPTAADRISAGKCSHEIACPVIGNLAGRAAGPQAELVELIVSNGCVAKVLQDRGESFFTAENFVVWGLSAIAEAAIRDRLIAQGMSEPRASMAAKGTVMAAAYGYCVSTERSACVKRETDWLNEPASIVGTCQSAMQRVRDSPDRIVRNTQQLREVDDRLATLRSSRLSVPQTNSTRIIDCDQS